MFVPFVISFWSFLDFSGPRKKKEVVVFDLFSFDSTLIYWSAQRIKKVHLGILICALMPLLTAILN